MLRFLSVIFVITLISCSGHKYKNPHVLINTSLGDIEIELYPDKAPKSVGAFLAHVDSGLYDNSSFYRVLKNDDMDAAYNSGLIQGGIFKTNPRKLSSLPGIPHESPRQTGLSHVNGTVSLARTTPGSATSEFFICIGDQTQFDSSRLTNPDGQGYAAFGKVFEGMDIVRKIQAQKNNGDVFTDMIMIVSIKKL